MTSQFVVDGLVSGVVIGLGAAGVTLTYSILRFANFAQGDYISWGAYGTLVLDAALGALVGGHVPALGALSFGWTLPLAMLVAALLTAGLALLLELILFGPLRRQGTALVSVMASFGASLALRSALEFLFTSRPAYFSRDLQIAMPVGFGLKITPNALAVLATAAVLVLLLHLGLTRTRAGRAMRAVSENPGLARLAGVDVARIIRLTWMVGGALSCAAGVALGLVVQIRPVMGFDLLLPIFAAAILGGIGSVPGAVAGGLIVGLTEAAAVPLVGAEWRAAVSFVVLILVLLLRPTGLFGRSE
ncbi:MAG TPA: branched-chain amino acid ABC transporter permease [Lichenihabitans sp.]|jgi:branched-chain amino acid transport system permease protein|nr:branched-chain amino acid ABC transporter permease [Lichenihabitans sp.]